MTLVEIRDSLEASISYLNGFVQESIRRSHSVSSLRSYELRSLIDREIIKLHYLLIVLGKQRRLTKKLRSLLESDELMELGRFRNEVVHSHNVSITVSDAERFSSWAGRVLALLN